MAKPYAEHIRDSLPAEYRARDEAGFLRRMLSLFGDELAALEDKVDGIRNHLSPERAPDEFLPWLSSWVALVLDETWSVEKRRQLIREALELYRWRGTIRGLRSFVEIYTGLTPEIVEEFKACWQVGVRSTVGEDTKVYEPDEDPHCFSVLVNSFEELTPHEKQKVIDIVEREKPAHTKVIHYGWVAKFWQVGVRSTVGVDMKAGG
ncbi:MAG: phage tail protein I [Planctomycetota bacterium]|jgi:phage tail-like protein